MSTQFNCQKRFYFKLFKQLYITIRFSVSTVSMLKTSISLENRIYDSCKAFEVRIIERSILKWALQKQDSTSVLETSMLEHSYKICSCVWLSVMTYLHDKC